MSVVRCFQRRSPDQAAGRGRLITRDQPGINAATPIRGARSIVGALAADTAVIDAHGRLIQREAAEQRAAFERLMREAEDRFRSPLGPEERVLLRTEIVRAAAGAIPGPEERAAFAQAVVEAVRAMVPPPAPPLPSEPAPMVAPSAQPEAAPAVCR